MTANCDQEKIFKSWAGVREVALIKEVATKGEHIQLCIIYGARKRKMSTGEYELLFHDIVQTYVKRLLNERLVCKAETVLRNVQKDVKCFFYQFACECDDPELREMIMDHLKKKEPDYENQLQDLQFHSEFLQQLKRSEAMVTNAKKHMKRLNLESLMSLDSATQQHLMIEMYFETRNFDFLQHINKYVMWDFLVETKQIDEIIRWCRVQQTTQEETHSVEQTDLGLKYCNWPLEPDMYEYAVRTLENNKDEVLRNYFAAAGFFFSDERDHVEVVLQRVCLTNSFERNRTNIKALNLGRFLYQHGLHYLLLNDFVADRQIEELTEEMPEESELLKLLVELKTRPLESLDGFEKINFHTTKYIESVSSNNDVECTLPTFFEFLTNKPTISSLQCSIASGSLKAIAYLRIMQQQQNDATIVMLNNLPTVRNLLKNFKNIDLKRLSKDASNYEKVARDEHHRGNSSLHRLNFIHYVKQSRSAYAIYLFLMEQLQHYAQITKTYLFTACESVYELALRTASTDTEVICHCIAFCEMLGFDTQKLRCFLKMKQYLAKNNINWSSDSKSHTSVIQETERILVQRLQNDQNSDGMLPLDEYSAAMAGKSMSLSSANKDRESLVMQYYATNNHYWRLLVLLQYFEIPLDQLKCIVKHFATRSMGDHLLRALSFTTSTPEETCSATKKPQCVTKRQLKSNKHKKGDKRTTNTSIETITSSLASCNDAPGAMNDQHLKHSRFFADCCNDEPDLFALILLNTNTGVESERVVDISSFLELMQTQSRPSKQQCSTVIQFLRTAVEQHLPIMAVLAASFNEEHELNLDWCWLVWLFVTSNQWNNLLRLAVGNKIQEFPWNLMEHLVSQGQIAAVVRSFDIFYPSNALVHLFRFLYLSMQNEFGAATVHELRLYCLAWSNDEIRLPLNPWSSREKLMKYTIRLLLMHIQNNFESITDQLKFLTCICKSGLSDVTGELDFCLLKEFCGVLQIAGSGATQRFPLNFIQLLQQERGDNKEFERVLECVLEGKEYDVAVRLATLLHKPISNIVYNKWVSELEAQLTLPFPDTFDNYTFPFEQYEQEVSAHSLPPETLVNFLLYAGSHLPLHAYKSRYYLLQKSLNVIKHHHLFPNESFDRDQIEYDMIVNYLVVNDDSEANVLSLYHSEYYEEIMLPERCVLYKSFLELKELAGIEDLNISNKVNLSEKQSKRLESLLNRLLDEGDIVEALRLQELFDVRPLDLRFIVFCMALAESMSSVYSMSGEERQLLSEVERSSFSKFTKRTLYAGPCGSGGGYLSDSCSTLEFEEIPSKEKQETLAILQGISSKLKYGINVAKRIISCYRAAMYLDKEYIDVLRTKDVQILLQSIAEEGCLHRLLVVSDIITSTQMQSQEIAELLALEITTAVVRPRFYILSPDQQAKLKFRNADLWGYNIDRDLHLFLELTPDRTKLGACLLEYCDALKTYRKYQDNKPYNPNYYFERLAEIIARYGVPNTSGNASSINSIELPSVSTNQAHQRTPQVLSHKKQNIIYVELLIKAHQSFVQECSMEGIANVLNRAKVLNNVLSQAKSWSLIVRMLTGIGRYREMFFCFDTLIENEQFESLLGQFDEEKTIGLRQAILGYLREYCAPQQGKELFKLAALHFTMYKDLAELWEREVEDILNIVYTTMRLSDDSASNTTKLRFTPEVINMLNQSLEYTIHATENYLLDNKLLLAQKSATKAELTAMQIDLANKALENPPSSSGHHLCFCVIQLKSRQQLKNLINNELSVSQSLILSRAYSYDINWADALLSQYVIQTKRFYLRDFLEQVDINDDVVENVVKGFQIYGQQHEITKQMDDHITELIDLVSSITLKYKLASVLTLKSTILSLINNESIHFLRDMKFGRRDENRNN